ncbi:MAG TPA: AMP-binding protein [Pseudonocardiaceae bacterium]|nr:AMP-binding protein [Pseudonocardiaceae bacterium]
MRDDVQETSAILDHPPEQVWRVLGTPELYSRFVPEISWCEVIEKNEVGRGPRCLVRVCPDRGTVITDHIDALVYRPGEHIVWCVVGGDSRWVSIELRPMRGQRTELVVQLMLPGLDAAHVNKRVHEVADSVSRYLSGRPARLADVAQHLDQPSTPISVAATLIKAGVVTASRPDRVARQISSLARWGATVPGGYQAAAALGEDVPALQDERGIRSYGTAVARGKRLASGLAANGVTAGQPVALMCRNHAAMAESIIACGLIGADAVLLNTGLSPTSVGEVIGQHRPVAVLADDEFAPAIRDVPGDFLRISTWADSEIGYPTVDDLIDAAPDTRMRPAERPGRIVVLTSGTTGMPKGARRRTPRGLGTAAALLSRIPLHAGERMFVAAPMFHTWGLAAMQISMPLRGTVVLQRRFDAERTLRAIAEHQCTALFAVPIMLQRILDLPERIRNRYDLSSLRIVASSGSALHGAFVTEFMDTFGDILYNLYGSTEVSWASIADPIDLRAAPTTAGRCPPGTRVGVFDDRLRPVPPGTEGQLFVDNEMLFEGYTEGGSLPMAHHMMSTGDRGYIDADGRLFITGRADEMIVSGGENVFPRPVEEVLIALPEVQDVAVVGVPDHQWGQRLAAYVVLRPGARLDGETVRDVVHQKLARFAVPRDVYFVPELPRNATGKVLKRLLNDDTWPMASRA